MIKLVTASFEYQTRLLCSPTEVLIFLGVRQSTWHSVNHFPREKCQLIPTPVKPNTPSACKPNMTSVMYIVYLSPKLTVESISRGLQSVIMGYKPPSWHQRKIYWELPAPCACYTFLLSSSNTIAAHAAEPGDTWLSY